MFRFASGFLGFRKNKGSRNPNARTSPNISVNYSIGENDYDNGAVKVVRKLY